MANQMKIYIGLLYKKSQKSKKENISPSLKDEHKCHFLVCKNCIIKSREEREQNYKLI